MKRILTLLVAGALIYSCGPEETTKKEDNKSTDTAATAAVLNDTTTDVISSVPSDTSVSKNADKTIMEAKQSDTTVDAEKALELIGSSGCITCHNIDKKIIGPAYKDVAKKYETTNAVIDTLVKKIQKGGMGNWGKIPMTPHPTLSTANAKIMVKYILSLDEGK